MLTLSNHEVGSTLRRVADAAYPEHGGTIRRFDIDIQSQECRTKHGDYSVRLVQPQPNGPTYKNCGIRIYNLSRPTTFIIKTTIHELAHHVDFCFNGTTGHKRPFYEHYRHLLETAHGLMVIDLAEAFDPILAADIDKMSKMIGAPSFDAQAPKSGFVFKVNSFEHKDKLKAYGFRFSPTEKLWVLEVSDEELSTRQADVKALAPDTEIQVVALNNNQIESVYFAILGKTFAGTNEDARSHGFKWHDKRGWYKRIKAAEKNATVQLCGQVFQTAPKFLGSL